MSEESGFELVPTKEYVLCWFCRNAIIRTLNPYHVVLDLKGHARSYVLHPDCVEGLYFTIHYFLVNGLNPPANEQH